MSTDLTSGDRFAEVSPGDPLYRDLQLRGFNRRFVGTPDSVFVVDDTDQAGLRRSGVMSVSSDRDAEGGQWSGGVAAVVAQHGGDAG